jgi:mannose/fructose/N-acetylgalactosamine-specific phosphotransferase system component IIC
VEWLKLALVGGVVALDSSAAFQIMISQPLVGGLLTGWALGDLWLGAFLGLLFQGLYLAEFPIGARIYPDSNLGAVQAAAVTVYLRHDLHVALGLSLLLGFFWAIPTSMIGGQMIIWQRRWHGRYLPVVDRLIATGRERTISVLYVAVILENFLVGALLTTILFLLGRQTLGWLASNLPYEAYLARWGMTLRGGLLGAGGAVIFMILGGNIRGYKRWLILAAGGVMAALWAIGY